MPKQEGQKSKLVTLLRILEQRTDETHRLNVPQLVQLLDVYKRQVPPRQTCSACFRRPTPARWSRSAPSWMRWWGLPRSRSMCLVWQTIYRCSSAARRRASSCLLYTSRCV